MTLTLDIVGRRILLLIGTAMMVVCLPMISFALLLLNDHVQLQGILAIIAALGFCSGFALGFGAVLWAILGEIVPTKIRSRAMGFFMAVGYLCNILIATCTITLIHALGSGDNPEKNGIAKLYLIFSFVGVCAWTFIYFLVRETKSCKIDDEEEET